jgi:glycine cleavage system aminomethyltransferase T
VPQKSEHPLPYESMLYDADEHGTQLGYVTSFMYSPVLQRHIGLARVRPDMARAGTEMRLEVAVAHRNTTVKARTAKLPLFNPSRKTAAE